MRNKITHGSQEHNKTIIKGQYHTKHIFPILQCLNLRLAIFLGATFMIFYPGIKSSITLEAHARDLGGRGIFLSSQV